MRACSVILRLIISSHVPDLALRKATIMSPQKNMKSSRLVPALGSYIKCSSWKENN